MRTEAGKPGGKGEKGLKRRDAIFRAALRLFREKGFRDTSINDIGAAARVTGPAIYRHFGSKDDVLVEAVEEASVSVTQALRCALSDRELTPEQALRAFVRAYVAQAIEHADIHAAYVLEVRHLPDERRKRARRNEQQLRDGWTQRLMKVRPELGRDEAQTTVNMAIFAVLSLCILPNRLDRDALEALASERVLALLLAPAGGKSK